VDGPLPAVANALADACGIRPACAPFTPERVLAALGELSSYGTSLRVAGTVKKEPQNIECPMSNVEVKGSGAATS
jgi:hypothetical protein